MCYNRTNGGGEMIIVKLQNILDANERSVAWVSKKTGIAISTLHKFNKNDTTSISYDILNKLCELFDVKVEDLIQYKKDEK